MAAAATQTKQQPAATEQVADGNGAPQSETIQSTQIAPLWGTVNMEPAHGAFMDSMIRTEKQAVKLKLERTPDDPNAAGLQLYLEQLSATERSVNSALLSATHRYLQHFSMHDGFEEDLRLANDVEAVSVLPRCESGNEYDDDEEDSVSEASSAAKVEPEPVDARTKKKQEAKKRRIEDAMLLVKEKKVRDDKGNLIRTVGPFPAPRLTVRSAKPGQLFASRKTLNQRTVMIKEEVQEDPDEFIPATQGPSGDYDVTGHLTEVLRPLSSDSLKKISESAKLNLKPGTSSEEFIATIVKTATRLGCEKACMLMDKFKVIDAVASYCHASRPDVMAHMGTNVDFLASLPDDLRLVLGPVLGMPKDCCSVGEMWERIVAMGFCTVLTNLRQKPIRRVASELGIKLKETITSTISTEKYSEAIVYTAFPRERIRSKASKTTKNTEVQFSVLNATIRSVGDMGFISFVVHNVSTMRRDLERHYSPEFEFGHLRWSILCMANKDNLALYLCQTGTVHCKFVISVVNKDPDESICNEGTQRFNSASAENDWGFNNVSKFDALLEANAGFWNAETDSITVEIGLVFVDSGKNPVAAPPKPVPKRGAEAERINKSVADELLESERLETVRKKLKQEFNKLQRDEEKMRKEMVQKQQKTFSSLRDSCNNEQNKITKAEKERERKLQQERKREEERARQVQEAVAEATRRIGELTEEQAELATRKTSLTEEVKELRKTVEASRQRQNSIDSECSQLDKKFAEIQRNMKRNKDKLTAARAAAGSPLPELPDEVSDTSDDEPEESVPASPTQPDTPITMGASATGSDKPMSEMVDEHELMTALQASLAFIIDA